jgi:sterol desaturase/sphingolipid hydroxylase (fatty acid hydroxylase superfamily)
MFDGIGNLLLFGAPKIEFSQIEEISKSAPEIIIWAAPVMFSLVLLEWFISHRQDRKLYNNKETLGSLLVGLGNVGIAFVIKFVLFALVVVIYNLVPWRMHFDWLQFLPCYIVFDFFSYWAHRISHQQRFWWATHIVHHSAEQFNLTVSFRLSWVQHLKLIFFLPVALIGFHPVIFFVVNQIAVLFQFWAHTEYIRKLPPIFEYIFATPSNHRVHHGTQDKYINKNYAATFVVWDRLFGTYQKEEEQVKYGLTHNIDHKSNPLHINFHEFADIWKDIRGTASWKTRLFYLFGDPMAVAQSKKTAPIYSDASFIRILKKRIIHSNVLVAAIFKSRATERYPLPLLPFLPLPVVKKYG